MNSRVAFENRKTMIDGSPVQIISGIVHYFRIPRACWRDRLEKAAALGCNCIESYIFWNLTEPEEGRFCMEDNLDFRAFFRMVQELGMYAMVRPGPYTCSECDNGGLPWWLMNKKDLRVRCSNAAYLEAVEKYWSVLLPEIVPLQYDNGGPIICMQIENEYGGYCHDKEYLQFLADFSRKSGITVPLTTSDGDCIKYIRSGMIDGAHMTMNFGFDAAKTLKAGLTVRPDDPPFCGEFWGSWFDHWGEGGHFVRDPDEQAKELDDILSMGGNVDIYLAAGGSQFGFMAGANKMPGEPYAPDSTSYDFDAPISETGDIRPKFHVLQQVIAKYRKDFVPSTPSDPEKRAYGKLEFIGTAKLFDHLDELSVPVESLHPMTMEELNQGYGFTLYRTVIEGEHSDPIALEKARDRVQVFLNRQPAGVIYRNDETFATRELHFPAGKNTVDLLVENLGRINYGPFVGRDPKGIVGSVMLGKQIRLHFKQYPLELKSLEKLTFDAVDTDTAEPAFHLAELEITGTPCDTFVVFPGVRGCVFVNGFALGRYWDIGPARTLYLPGCFLRQGKNQLVVFETTSLHTPFLELAGEHDLGPERSFWANIKV